MHRDLIDSMIDVGLGMVLIVSLVMVMDALIELNSIDWTKIF